jgi:hypothetical protein
VSVLEWQPGNRIARLRMAQIASIRMNIAVRRADDAEELSFARESEKWLRKYDRGGPARSPETGNYSPIWNEIFDPSAPPK